MNELPSFLKSKKFWGLVVGLVLTSLIQLVPALEPLKEMQEEFVALIVAYIVGSGLQALGKEK